MLKYDLNDLNNMRREKEKKNLVSGNQVICASTVREIEMKY